LQGVPIKLATGFLSAAENLPASIRALLTVVASLRPMLALLQNRKHYPPFCNNKGDSSFL
jgi:hypothetical protein